MKPTKRTKKSNNLNVYIPGAKPATEVREEIGTALADLGLVNQKGGGDIAGLFAGIISGEIVVWVAPSPDVMDHAQNVLADASRYETDGLASLAKAIETARGRRT